MIKIENLSYSYTNKNILNQVNLYFSKGNIYRITGKNGVGKTTLLKLIYGSLIPTEGVIVKKCKANEICYLSNVLPLDDNLTVRDHINFICSEFNIENKILHEKQKLLYDLQIEVFENHYIENLSLGTKKKVMFFLMYLINYKVILLDEFFSGIDKSGINIISKIIIEYVKNGSTIIFVTHQDDEAKYLKYVQYEL